MRYKYLYKSKANGIKIKTNKKLDPDKYILIHEVKSVVMKEDEFKIKNK